MNRARRRLMENVRQEQVRIVPLNEFYDMPDFELTYEYFTVWRSCDDDMNRYYLIESTWNRIYTNSSNFYYMVCNGTKYGGEVVQEGVEYKWYQLIDNKWVIQKNSANGIINVGGREKLTLLSLMDWYYPNGSVGRPVNFSWDYELITKGFNCKKTAYYNPATPSIPATVRFSTFYDAKGYSTSCVFDMKVNILDLPCKDDTTKNNPYYQCRRVVHETKLTYTNIIQIVGTKAIQNDDGTITAQTLKNYNGRGWTTHRNSYADKENSGYEIRAFLCDLEYEVNNFTLWRWK